MRPTQPATPLDEPLTIFINRLPDGRLAPQSLSVEGAASRMRITFNAGATMAGTFVAGMEACLRDLADRMRTTSQLRLPDFAMRIGAVLLRRCRVAAGRPMDGTEPLIVRFGVCDGPATDLLAEASLPAAARAAASPSVIDADAITEYLTDALEPLFALREGLEAGLRRHMPDAPPLSAAFHTALSDVNALQDRLSEQIGALYAQQSMQLAEARLATMRPPEDYRRAPFAHPALG